MEHVEYEANGVRLDGLDDYQLQRETRGIDLELCVQAFIGFNGSLAVLTWTTIAYPHAPELLPLQIGLVGAALLSLTAGFIGFLEEAKKKRAPSSGGITRSDHITGFGAFVGLALAGVILAAGFLGQLNYPNFVIPEEFGIAATFALGGGFLMMALAPRITDLSIFSGLLRALRWLTIPLNPLGRLMSVIDSWLVYSVAPTVGCTLKNTAARYSVFTLHLASATVLAWFCGPPFGLLGISWAVLSAIAVARRWAWTETEREKLMQDPGLRQSELRVGTDQDLRDEALWGLILLVFVLPVGMRQFYLATGTPTIFSLTDSIRDDPTAWLGFFGVELLKALPFVDWADIYGAHGDTRILANSPLALHAVFATRVLIDLVFIGALIQAISISIALSRHKRQFLLNRDVHILDDRIERAEIARLAKRRNGTWEFRKEIDLFIHYDSQRLSRLRLGTRKNTRLYAALVRLFELKNLRFAPPGEQLVDVAKDSKPDRKALEAALRLVENEGHYDLDYLAETRKFLNWKRDIEDVRQRILQIMIHMPPSRERNAALLDVIRGESIDSLAATRILAAEALSRVARQNLEVVAALNEVATTDRAMPVRRKVAALVKARGLKMPPVDTSKKRAA